MPDGSGRPTFRETLRDAMREFAARGFTSDVELHDWLERMRLSLGRSMLSDDEILELVRGSLTGQYDRLMDGHRIEHAVPGVSRYTIDRVAPRLRAELDRRIHASADLIRLNRDAAIQKTLQRFSGWATSVPAGADTETEMRPARDRIMRETAQTKFEARRVAIDQGHKLVANVSEIVAKDAGAIAAIWHDRGVLDKHYDARPEHLARSGKYFLVRDSWAMREGLLRKSGHQYTDEIEQPAQLPFCSCSYEWVTSPRRLPDEMLTKKGQDWLAAPIELRAA